MSKHISQLLIGFVPVGLPEICGLQTNSRNFRDHQDNNIKNRGPWLIVIHNGILQREAAAVLKRYLSRVTNYTDEAY